jgi:hypothetical protein
LALSIPLEGFGNLRHLVRTPTETCWNEGVRSLPLKLENLFVFFPTVWVSLQPTFTPLLVFSYSVAMWKLRDAPDSKQRHLNYSKLRCKILIVTFRKLVQYISAMECASPVAYIRPSSKFLYRGIHPPKGQTWPPYITIL